MADAPEVYDNHSTLEVLEHHPSASRFAAQHVELTINSHLNGAHPANDHSTLELSPVPGQARFLTNEAYNTREKTSTVESSDSQQSSEPAKEDWKRKRVCGIPLLFLFIGLLVVVAVIAAVVGGVLGSQSKSNNTAPRQQQSAGRPRTASPGGTSVTASAPGEFSSLTASSTSSAAPSTRPNQETWIDGTLNKTYTFEGHYGYYLIDDGEPTNKVSMYEVSTFTDENMRWHIQNVTEAEQASYAANTDWGTEGPTQIFRISPRRNAGGLFLTPDQEIADSITGGLNKTRRDIPIKVLNQDKDHLSLQAWFFRPLNTSLEVVGGEIPWTIHNVAFGWSWEFDVEHSGNWIPMMRRFGEEENDDYRTWILPLPIG